MRAIVIRNPGKESRLERVERPSLEPDFRNAVIRVHAFGVNRADLLQRMGRYPAPPGIVPDIPGLEYSGEILHLPKDQVCGWKVGDRVMGIVSGGAYAEEVLSPVDHLFPIPERMNFGEAASLPEAFVTAWDALVLQGGLSAKSTLLIHAAGSGVGRAALEVSREMGAEVFATSRTPAKLARIEATYGVQTQLRQGDWPLQLQEKVPEGFSLVLDLVGGEEAGIGLTLLRSKGTLVVVGLTGGVRTELRLDQLLMKRATLKGTVLRSRTHEEKSEIFAVFAQEWLPRFSAGRVGSILDTKMSVEDVGKAHERMHANDTFGKLVLEW